jgi:hypothetical protein
MAPRRPHKAGEQMMTYARRLKAILQKDPKANPKLREASPESIANRLYELGLGPRQD